MRLLFSILFAAMAFSGIYAQNSNSLTDCNREKDKVSVDWSNETNSRYAEREAVEKFSQKKLRSFYCSNLTARDRLESDGMIHTEGSIVVSDSESKFLIFNINLGDVTYQDKLFIHVGPRQKLASK